MGLQVGPPSVLDRGLERHHEHTLRTQALRELVGGEGLAEPHLRIPQESRCCHGVLGPDRLEVPLSLLDRARLLRTHRKRLMMRAAEHHALPQFGDRREDIVGRASHPLTSRTEDRVLETLRDQTLPHIRVTKHRTVVPLSQLIHMQRVCLLHLPLGLANPRVHIRLRRLPHLQQPLVPRRRIIRRPRVDPQPRLGPFGEEFVDSSIHRRPVPLGERSSL